MHVGYKRVGVLFTCCVRAEDAKCHACVFQPLSHQEVPACKQIVLVAVFLQVERLREENATLRAVRATRESDTSAIDRIASTYTPRRTLSQISDTTRTLK